MTTTSLAHSVARYAPAEDVNDLDTALRLVTCLREKITQMAGEAEPASGEHAVFLDDEHQRKVELLYDRRKLTYEQEDDLYNEEYEFNEVFEDFVSSAIDLAWDMAQSETADVSTQIVATA